MNLILIGLMGSGKTEVGRRLAGSLGLRFVDTDEMVEAETGTTIASIFEGQGERRFRELESLALGRALAAGDGVVATGGGAVLDAANVALMRRTGIVFYLEVTPSEAARRTGGDGTRPLLAGDGEQVLTGILAGRKSIYEAAAHEVVPTEGLSIEDVAREIEARWKRYV